MAARRRQCACTRNYQTRTGRGIAQRAITLSAFASAIREWVPSRSRCTNQLAQYLDHRKSLRYRQTHCGVPTQFVRDYAIEHPGEPVRADHVLAWITRVPARRRNSPLFSVRCADSYASCRYPMPRLPFVTTTACDPRFELLPSSGMQSNCDRFWRRRRT